MQIAELRREVAVWTGLHCWLLVCWYESAWAVGISGLQSFYLRTLTHLYSQMMSLLNVLVN